MSQGDDNSINIPKAGLFPCLYRRHGSTSAPHRPSNEINALPLVLCPHFITIFHVNLHHQVTTAGCRALGGPQPKCGRAGPASASAPAFSPPPGSAGLVLDTRAGLAGSPSVDSSRQGAAGTAEASAAFRQLRQQASSTVGRSSGSSDAAQGAPDGGSVRLCGRRRLPPLAAARCFVDSGVGIFLFHRVAGCLLRH